MFVCHAITLKHQYCRSRNGEIVRDQTGSIIAVLCESHRGALLCGKTLTSRDGKSFRMLNDGSVELLPFNPTDAEIHFAFIEKSKI